MTPSDILAKEVTRLTGLLKKANMHIYELRDSLMDAQKDIKDTLYYEAIQETLDNNTEVES